MAIQMPRLVANDTVVAAELEGEMVLLNAETGIYFGLDALGTQIWQLLMSGATPEETVESLLTEYEVEPAKLRADVTEFLDQLVARGLMQVASA